MNERTNGNHKHNNGHDYDYDYDSDRNDVQVVMLNISRVIINTFIIYLPLSLVDSLQYRCSKADQTRLMTLTLTLTVTMTRQQENKEKKKD